MRPLGCRSSNAGDNLPHHRYRNRARCVPPMGQVVSSSRKLDYIFNRVLRMSRHRRLASDAAAALYMLSCRGRSTRRCCDIERSKDATLVLVGEIAAEPPWTAIRQDREPGYCPCKKVGTMSEPRGVSIIVVNYNNAEFLAAAIDSALGQEYPLCEVIVVDDCSTDNSQAVIARYRDRIRSVFRQANGGQTAALNSAWPLARYPILIFLDSDDVLLPHAASTFARRWSDEIVKIQAPLVSIDKAGRPLGNVAPKYPPNLDTAIIRAELLRTGGSPNSPASGNAYSRSLLDRIRADGGFKLENSREHWMDAILECNAPFYGEVVTLYEPLACYRIHESNLYAFNTVDVERFAAKAHTFDMKVHYFAQRCSTWGIHFDPIAARKRSIWLLECRMVVAKLGAHPAVEPTFTILCLAIKACIGAQLPVFDRILRTVWFAGVAAAPSAVARKLIAFRFVPSQRPKWFELLFSKALGIARRLRVLHIGKRPTGSVGREARRRGFK